MKEERAQLKVVFELIDLDKEYLKFINNQNYGMWFYYLNSWAATWKVEFREFAKNDSTFWDWKSGLEDLDYLVIWFKDKTGELYGFGFPKDIAVYGYGLMILSNNENIQSSWS
jgi:hypothetical protein